MTEGRKNSTRGNVPLAALTQKHESKRRLILLFTSFVRNFSLCFNHATTANRCLSEDISWRTKIYLLSRCTSVYRSHDQVKELMRHAQN